MTEYDKAGRYLIKRDPPGFFRWLLGRGDVAFHVWIDARRLALPDQGDLANDLVAAFAVGDHFEALCVELQAASEADAVSRLLLGYVPRLLTEPGGPDALVLGSVGGAVVNLRGSARAAGLEYRLAMAPACWLGGGILQRTLREEDAAGTLAEIASGTISRWLLAWLPLMQGGAEAGIIEGWQREAKKEPRRLDQLILAMLARTFANLAGCQEVWLQGLEGWAMIKSEFLEELREDVRTEAKAEGKAEGEAEGRLTELHDTVLLLGQQRFGKGPSRQQKAQLKRITDLARFHRIRARLLEAASWTDLLNTP